MRFNGTVVILMTVILMTFSFSLICSAQETESEEIPQAFEYSSIFKISKEGELGPGFISQLHLNLSYGVRFHRYDPKFIDSQEGTSSYSNSSNVYLGTLEYRPIDILSVYLEGSYEEQIVERYDGIDLSSSRSTLNDNLLGLQLVLNPVFIGLNVGQKYFPVYFDRGNAGFGYEQLHTNTIGVRIGLRRTVSRNLFLNFFLDYKEYEKMDSVVSELSGRSVGGSVWIQHSSGIGINFREERGELKSEEIIIGLREFSAMVFIGL